MINMKRHITFFGICFIIIMVFKFYDSNKANLDMVSEEKKLAGVTLIPDKDIYKIGISELAFTLVNDSGAKICFGSERYVHGEKLEYYNRESELYLQKQINGDWITQKEQQKKEGNTTAGVEVEMQNGEEYRIIINDKQYLEVLTTGRYKAIFPFYVVIEPGSINYYSVTTEFELQ